MGLPRKGTEGPHVCIGTDRHPCPSQMVLLRGNKIRCAGCNHAQRGYPLYRASVANSKKEALAARSVEGSVGGVVGAVKVIDAMLRAEGGQ